MKQTIVISDIHGCLAETKLLLDKCNYNHGIDHVISVGDLVDRGPEPLECIRFMKDINATVVLGNHEDKYLRFWKHEQLKLKNPNHTNPMSVPPKKVEFYKKLTTKLKPNGIFTLQAGYLHQFDYRINDETGKDFFQISLLFELKWKNKSGEKVPGGMD
jgi:predicted phosphodiesterase